MLITKPRSLPGVSKLVFPIGAAAMAGVVIFLSFFSPFRQSAVIRHFEKRTGARVSIGQFTQKWFPPDSLLRSYGLLTKEATC